MEDFGGKFRLRRPGRKQPLYDPEFYPNTFSIELHYAGELGDWTYLNGEVASFDFINQAYFSMEVLNHMVLSLKIPRIPMLYKWLPQGSDINRGLKSLDNDDDIQEMIATLPDDKLFRLYVVHLNIEETVRLILEAKQVNRETEERLLLPEPSTLIIEDLDIEVESDATPSRPMKAVRGMKKEGSANARWNQPLSRQSVDATHEDVINDVMEEGFMAEDSEDDPEYQAKDSEAGESEAKSLVNSETGEVQHGHGWSSWAARQGIVPGPDYVLDVGYLSEGEYVDKVGWGLDETLTDHFRFPQFNMDRDLKLAELKVTQEFGSFDNFKKACKVNSIKQRRDIRFAKNDKVRVRCVCMKKDCAFFVVCRPGAKEGSYQIRTANLDHGCPVDEDVRAASPKFLAELYIDRFRIDPSWSLKNIIHTIVADLELKINTTKAWRTKKAALFLIHGEDSKQFTKLFAYKAEIERTNPGSTVVIDYDILTFQRIYVCLHGLKEGFKAGCRRIVCLDGCFLKHMAGWQILAAVGMDANDAMFPLAWAIVEKENTENWRWFMELVAKDLEISDGYHWTFMSDRQKGLMNVMVAMFPYAEHRYCVLHMYRNFVLKFTRAHALRDELWAAARSTNLAAFKSKMENLKEIGATYAKDGMTPYDWLDQKNGSEWCRAFFQTHTKSEFIVNNHSESFNDAILDARDMPIISCLESIRSYCMKKIATARRVLSKMESTKLCPTARGKLQKNISLACNSIARFDGEHQYEVDTGFHRYVVNLKDHTCACGAWQLSGIPCPHAIACVKNNKERVESYVDDCFTIERCKRSYDYVIHPLNGPELWLQCDGPKLKGPEMPVKKKGPLQKKRRKHPTEYTQTKTNKKGEEYTIMSRSGMQMTCANCKRKGHNKRSCKQVAGETSSMGTTPPAIMWPPSCPSGSTPPATIWHATASAASTTASAASASATSAFFPTGGTPPISTPTAIRSTTGYAFMPNPRPPSTK